MQGGLDEVVSDNFLGGNCEPPP